MIFLTATLKGRLQGVVTMNILSINLLFFNPIVNPIIISGVVKKSLIYAFVFLIIIYRFVVFVKSY